MLTNSLNRKSWELPGNDSHFPMQHFPTCSLSRVKYNRALKASSQEIYVCIFSLNQMFEGFFELSRVCQSIPLSVVKILCYDRENDLLRIIQYHFLAQLGMRN